MSFVRQSIVLVYTAVLILTGRVYGDDGVIVDESLKSAQQLQSIEGFWTPEIMRRAAPMSSVVEVPAGLESAATATRTWEARPPVEQAIPGYAPGWAPDSGPRPDAKSHIDITPSHPLYATTREPIQPAPFPPPALPTEYEHYAPFNRWTWRGDSRIEKTPTGNKIRVGYKTYPISTVGRLFIILHGTTYACSASVIQRNTIATTGHCVSDGAGTFATDFLFCPSYTVDENGEGIPDPKLGCWSGISAATTAAYHHSAAIDRDIACIVTARKSTVQKHSLGDVTGWTGRIWNLPSRIPTFALGYPAGAPFPGHHLIVSASSEWYIVNMTLGDGQVSKYIGNDMTGGSSGGPWWVSMRGTGGSVDVPHSSDYPEYPDVDGSDMTDPFQGGRDGPFLNGINSHSRCALSGCPPGSIFLSETGSPQFRNTASDDDESEDVFKACFDHGGV